MTCNLKVSNIGNFAFDIELLIHRGLDILVVFQSIERGVENTSRDLLGAISIRHRKSIVVAKVLITECEVETVHFLRDRVSLLDEAWLVFGLFITDHEVLEGVLKSFDSHEEFVLVELLIIDNFPDFVRPRLILRAKLTLVQEVVSLVILPGVLELQEPNHRAIAATEAVEAFDNKSAAGLNALIVIEA